MRFVLEKANRVKRDIRGHEAVHMMQPRAYLRSIGLYTNLLTAERTLHCSVSMWIGRISRYR